MGGETEREKKWRMKIRRMETHREWKDGSRGGEIAAEGQTDSQTDGQSETSLLAPTPIFMLAFQLQVSRKVCFFIFNSPFQE